MTYVGNERKKEHHVVSVGEGIGGCDVCNTYEGGMPLECSGERVSAARSNAIYSGDAEYVRGRWYVAIDFLVHVDATLAEAVIEELDAHEGRNTTGDRRR